jgi:hypothetical protein
MSNHFTLERPPDPNPAETDGCSANADRDSRPRSKQSRATPKTNSGDQQGIASREHSESAGRGYLTQARDAQRIAGETVMHSHILPEPHLLLSKPLDNFELTCWAANI